MKRISLPVNRTTTPATVALALVFLCASASPAIADSTSEAIQLSWDGSTYAATTTVSYFGTPVIVPGDSADRTLQVRNDGPTGGYLTARIVNVDLRTPQAPDVHHNSDHQAPDNSGLYRGAGDQGNAYDDILIRWGDGVASLNELDANVITQLMHVPIAKDEVVPVPLEYEFSISSAAGNQSNVDLREASFEVELEISGDAGAPPRVKPPELTQTGAGDTWVYWVAGSALVGFGTIGLLARRNRSSQSPRAGFPAV